MFTFEICKFNLRNLPVLRSKFQWLKFQGLDNRRIFVSRVMRSEVSRMKVFENIFYDFDTFQICFFVMICLWFGFAVMILILFQFWFWYGFSMFMFFDVGQTFDLKPTHRNHIQKPYQNHIKIVSKPYQNHIKIVSKSYQNQIKTAKTCEKSTKNLSLGCFCFFFWSQPLEPHQNRIQIISKTYQNRIKIVSKPYQNHTETIKTLENSTEILSLGCFCFFIWSQFTGTISKPYHNHIKLVSKLYQNRNKTHIES